MLGPLLSIAAGVEPLTLHLANATEPGKHGAVCLDGSPPGYYLRKASRAADVNRWVVYMQGGAWCSSPSQCASRSLGHLGSSRHFAPTYPMEGVLDSNLTRNPLFGSWSHALIAYCDGGSFSGEATSSISWPNPSIPSRNLTLFFRGRRVLQLVVRELMSKHGLGAAEEVMLAGGSAGGLATLLQAECDVGTRRDGPPKRTAPSERLRCSLDARPHSFVGGLLPPTVRKYRAVPVSGFFLMHSTLGGADSFAEGIRAVYSLHNASVSAECAASVPAGESWRCFFANYSYAHARTPMFPIQSSVDLYQLFAILQAGGWDAGCLNRGGQFAHCTTAQLEAFNAYAASLLADWSANLSEGKASLAGEGAFIESCLEHVAEYRGPGRRTDHVLCRTKLLLSASLLRPWPVVP